MVNKDGMFKQLFAIVEGLEREFNELTYVTAGALFREHIHEYGSAIYAVIDSCDLELSTAGADRISQICRRLCELSREMLFSVDRDALSESCVIGVASLLKLSLEAIDSAVKNPSINEVGEEVATFHKNIAKRALPDPWKSIATVV